QKPADDRPVFSIGVVADIQYCDCETANNRHYRQSLTKLDEAITVFNGRNVDFVVSLGDLIDRDYDSFYPVKDRLIQLQMPVYHVLGNHDFSVVADRLQGVPTVLGLENRYYSNVVSNYRLIYMDGN